jgi:heat shock protein HtpX
MRPPCSNTFKTTMLLALARRPVHRDRRRPRRERRPAHRLLIGLLFVGGSYWFSDKLAIAAARAKPVSREELPGVYAIVEDLARRDDMPMPACTCPRGTAQRVRHRPQPDHAAVCVTRRDPAGARRDELRGVLATSCRT